MGFPSFFPHANPISLKPLSMTTLIPNFERKELPRDGVFQNETVSPTNMQFRSYWSYWQHAIYSFCLCMLFQEFHHLMMYGNFFNGGSISEYKIEIGPK